MTGYREQGKSSVCRRTVCPGITLSITQDFTQHDPGLTVAVTVLSFDTYVHCGIKGVQILQGFQGDMVRIQLPLPR